MDWRPYEAEAEVEVQALRDDGQEDWLELMEVDDGPASEEVSGREGAFW